MKFKFKIGHQPPRKKVTQIADINNILLYSPKKNIAKVIEEYSTKKPATNSASASGKSNGALFVSAYIEIINIINIGNSGKQNQVFFWIYIISIKFKEFEQIIIGKIHKLIEIS
jgi:hypothetical protein